MRKLSSGERKKLYFPHAFHLIKIHEDFFYISHHPHVHTIT